TSGSVAGSSVALQQHDLVKDERRARLSFAFLTWLSKQVPLALFLQAVLASSPGDLLPVIENAGALPSAASAGHSVAVHARVCVLSAGYRGAIHLEATKIRSPTLRSISAIRSGSSAQLPAHVARERSLRAGKMVETKLGPCHEAILFRAAMRIPS